MHLHVVCNIPFQDELTLEGYRHHIESQKAAPPLTEAEENLMRLQENEVGHHHQEVYR